MASRHAAENWKAQVGDRWLAYVDQFEAMLQPIGDAAIGEAGFQPGENVADVGCGGGATSLAIARKLGAEGHVTGIDIAPQLVAEAQQRALRQGIGNVSFEAGDAQYFTPGRAPFDKIFSRFGVMFFDDTLAGFTNMRSWLKPGGEMVFATWAAPEFNPWMTQIQSITAKYVQAPPPDPEEAGPFRLADEAATKAMMEAAGFTNVSIRRWSGEQHVPHQGSTPEEALHFALNGLEIGKALEELDDSTKALAIQEFADLFAANYREGSVTLQASALFVRGTAS